MHILPGRRGLTRLKKTVGEEASQWQPVGDDEATGKQQESCGVGRKKPTSDLILTDLDFEDNIKQRTYRRREETVAPPSVVVGD